MIFNRCKHDWKEVKRSFHEYFSDFIDKKYDLPSCQFTRFFYQCSVCGKRKIKEIKGDWT